MKKYIIVVEAEVVRSKQFKEVEELRGLSPDGFAPATHYWAEWKIGIQEEFEDVQKESEEEAEKGIGIIVSLSSGQWFDAEVWTSQAILDKLRLKEIK